MAVKVDEPSPAKSHHPLHGVNEWLVHLHADPPFSRHPMKQILKGVLVIMSDLNRGIMKFDGADSPAGITLSALVILGSIAILVAWAVQSAYTFR